MKNLFVVILVLLSTALFAQKGSWYIGGSVGVVSDRQKGSDAISTWQLSPEAGTFLCDKIQVGLALNITGGTKDVAEKSSGFTAYGRYFFNPGKAFRPFVGLAIPYAKLSSPDFLGGYIETTRTGINANARLGYALSERWTVVGSLAAIVFVSSKTGDVVNQKLNIGANTLGNPFNIGIYYSFLK